MPTVKVPYTAVVSPPSRGAWIEMQAYAPCGCEARGRPPRGGRGLKFGRHLQDKRRGDVAPLAGGVD